MALFDSLFCQEELFIAIDESEDRHEHELPHHRIADPNKFLSTLIANEHQTHIPSSNLKAPDNHPYLNSARKEAIDWIRTTSSRFRFNPLTVVLAANYLDRCFLSSSGLHLQPDKPWMKQLSAVACLSLAAKVEETHVPFLLDLQLSGEEFTTGFVFEPKTVRRMELLVLSTLNWRMSPVTPIAFIECILPELKNDDDDDDEDDNDNVAEILRRCEFVLLSVLSDWRWVQFAPSVWAAAVILHSMDDGIMQQVLELLPVSKERVKVCYGVIVELMGGGSKKRKSGRAFEPPSPNGVSASCFSFDSSSSLDSWASSVSSSTTFEPPSLKRLNFYRVM